MIPRSGIWRDVHVGSYVKDANGKTWKVTDLRFDDETVRLVDAAGKAGKIPWPAEKHPVTILEPSMTDAVALLQDKLGAEVIS